MRTCISPSPAMGVPGLLTCVPSRQTPTSPCRRSLPDDFELECPICLSGFVLVRLGCGHTACLDCARESVKFQVTSEAATFESLGCWASGCSHSLAADEASDLIIEPSLRRQLERQSRDAALARMPDFHWCPRCEDGGFAEPSADGEAAAGAGAAAEGGVGRFISCGHGHCFCTACKAPAHEGMTCEAFATSHEFESARAIAKSSKECPGCRAPTQRSEGCSHMTCHQCKFEWCWLCGGKYRGNYTFGSTCTCAELARKEEEEADRAEMRRLGAPAAGDWEGEAAAAMRQLTEGLRRAQAEAGGSEALMPPPSPLAAEGGEGAAGPLKLTSVPLRPLLLGAAVALPPLPLQRAQSD